MATRSGWPVSLKPAVKKWATFTPVGYSPPGTRGNRVAEITLMTLSISASLEDVLGNRVSVDLGIFGVHQVQAGPDFGPHVGLGGQVQGRRPDDGHGTGIENGLEQVRIGCHGPS
jgi:hypothetical protein